MHKTHHFYVQMAYISNLKISSCWSVCISHPRQLTDRFGVAQIPAEVTEEF